MSHVACPVYVVQLTSLPCGASWRPHQCTVVPAAFKGTSEEHNGFSHTVSTPCAAVAVQQYLSGFFVR
jgi:hypothetical protein